jgi:hypothetical protein
LCKNKTRLKSLIVNNRESAVSDMACALIAQFGDKYYRGVQIFIIVIIVIIVIIERQAGEWGCFKKGKYKKTPPR